MKVYGTEARDVLDPGAVPIVLSKGFVDRLVFELDKTERRINAVMGVKSPVVGIDKELHINLDENVVKLSLVVVQGSPYDVIVGYQTMESMEGILDMGHRVA